MVLGVSRPGENVSDALSCPDTKLLFGDLIYQFFPGFVF